MSRSARVVSALVCLLLGACATTRHAASPPAVVENHVRAPASTVAVPPPALPASPARRSVSLLNDETGHATAIDAGAITRTTTARKTPMQRWFPAQYAASQSISDPASSYWALLIGINAYSGSTEDSIGSKPDAQSLSSFLRSMGWRSDHIMVLTDSKATASNIVQSIRWLASKTNNDSTVVFHYAGHEKPASGDRDRDHEKRDVALWATDNKLVVDGTLGSELNRVRAQRMWLDFATCRAAGFDDAGTVKPGRVITYASSEESFGYEDTSLKHTVMGYYLVVEGLMHRRADTNGDGIVTVEEAFSWSRAPIKDRTGGKQITLITDKLSGSFSFVIARPPSGGSGGSGGSTNPSPAPSPSCLVLC
ncbi:MAG: caspase domain-containing protein [Actinomycetota bacterium]